MIVCVQQCAAVEGDGKGDLEIGCCCRAIEGGTALLSARVHSAAYVLVVYKRRPRGLMARTPRYSSKDSYFDGIRVNMTRTGCSKRRRAGTHTCVFRRLRRKGQDVGTLHEGSLQKVISSM